MTITRRNFLEHSLAFAAMSALAGGPVSALEIGDDGLHKQSWFIDSFLDLRDDQKDAFAQGKNLAIIWEQRGCPYCGEMHKVNLAIPAISNFIKTNFHVLQLDFRGSRNVTDFDGKVMSEQKLAQRWRVTGTPSVVFFPNSAAELPAKPGHEVEIWRLLGYWKPYHFISNFEYVRRKQYKSQPFYKYLDEKTARLKAEGKDVDIW